MALPRMSCRWEVLLMNDAGLGLVEKRTAANRIAKFSLLATSCLLLCCRSCAVVASSDSTRGPQEQCAGVVLALRGWSWICLSLQNLVVLFIDSLNC